MEPIEDKKLVAIEKTYGPILKKDIFHESFENTGRAIQKSERFSV